MHSMAPRPCSFMCSRARSVRYFFIRSQLTRCCQSNPAMPKFAVPMVSPELKPRGFAVDENSSRLIPIAEDHIAASPSAIGEPAAAEGRTVVTLMRCDQPACSPFEGTLKVRELELTLRPTPPLSWSARVLPRIGFEPGRLDAGDGAGLVAVGRVAGYADRADDVAGRGSDQHAAGIGDHASLAGGRQHGEELRGLGRARGERTRAETHAERAPGLAEGDVEAQEAGLVLALERDQVSAGVEHGDGQRRAIGVAAFLERDVDDGRGLSKRDDRHIGSKELSKESWLGWFEITASRGSPNRPIPRILPPRPRRCVWFPRSRRASSPPAAARCRALCPRPASCADP